MTAKRIQRKRTKGWRMPEGAVYVGRPSRWGNMWHVVPLRRSYLDEWAKRHPHHVYNPLTRSYLGTFDSEERARYWAVQGFRRDFDGDLTPLRGKDLVCWCPTHSDGCAGNCGTAFDNPPCPAADQPCHADVLLELANR